MYQTYKQYLLSGHKINLEKDKVMVALVSSSFNEYDEVSDLSIIAKEELNGKRLDLTGSFYADDVSFYNVVGDVSGCVIYSGSVPIIYLDNGLPLYVEGDIRIIWKDSIFTL